MLGGKSSQSSQHLFRFAKATVKGTRASALSRRALAVSMATIGDKGDALQQQSEDPSRKVGQQ